MTRYQTIASLGDTFLTLMGKGLIPVHLLDWKVYYEAYVNEYELLLKEHGRPKKTHAAQHIAHDFDISRRTMFYIISFMEETV
jgi:hypothetical protein